MCVALPCAEGVRPLSLCASPLAQAVEEWTLRNPGRNPSTTNNLWFFSRRRYPEWKDLGFETVWHLFESMPDLVEVDEDRTAVVAVTKGVCVCLRVCVYPS